MLGTKSAKVVIKCPPRRRWEWDDEKKCLIFARGLSQKKPLSRRGSGRSTLSAIGKGKVKALEPEEPASENKLALLQLIKSKGSNQEIKGKGKEGVSTNITFRDIVGSRDEIRFKAMQSRSKQPKVVTLGAIKEVVLFQVVEMLPGDFFEFISMAEVDRLLRALLVYFQFYIQVWSELMTVKEQTDKVRNVRSDQVFNHLRQDLADIRSIVGREYSTLLIATEQNKAFHHFGTGREISQTDIILFELFYRVASRMVWICMNRRYHNVIDAEIGRLFRTSTFNFSKNTEQIESFLPDPREMSVLYDDVLDESASGRKSKKLLLRSPVIHELLKERDYRLLEAGTAEFKTRDMRIRFLEKAFFAPEEELFHLGINIGILGRPRGEFDTMLFPSKGEKKKSKVRMSLATSRTMSLHETMRGGRKSLLGEKLKIPSSYSSKDLYETEIRKAQL